MRHSLAGGFRPSQLVARPATRPAVAYLVLILAICVPLLIVGGMMWLSGLLSGEDPAQDITGRSYEPKQRKLLYRFRLWLMSSPKKLDYRRDKKGRFRRVRRG